MRQVPTFEAVYYDDEPGERLGGWEVVRWEFVTLDGGAKQGRKEAAYFSDEEGCVKEAARLNKLVDPSLV